MTDMKLQIQILHDQRNELTRTIADYVTREGILTSYALMEKKATQAGYIKIDFDASLTNSLAQKNKLSIISK